MIEIKYKGTEIRYDEEDNKWICGEYDLEKDSLSKIKKTLTINMAEELKAKKIFVYKKQFWGDAEFERVTIVSYPEGDKDAWTRDGGGRRSKESIECLYECSDVNETRIDQIKKLRKEKEKIGKEIKIVEGKMIKFKK